MLSALMRISRLDLRGAILIGTVLIISKRLSRNILVLGGPEFLTAKRILAIEAIFSLTAIIVVSKYTSYDRPILRAFLLLIAEQFSRIYI